MGGGPDKHGSSVKDDHDGRPSMEVPVDAPPTYEDSLPAASPNASASVPPDAPISASADNKTDPKPPNDAQRALIPLHIEQSNTAIREHYVILDSAQSTSATADVSSGTKNSDGRASSSNWVENLMSGGSKNSKADPKPDVYLKTTNSRITSSLWLDKALETRKVSVFASTTNSKIDLAVYTGVDVSSESASSTSSAKHQPLDLTASSTNSSVNVALPPSFHGQIVLSTSNSKHVLSTELQRKSVRIPVEADDPNHAARYQIGGPKGGDRARVKSSNASVGAKFTTEIGNNGMPKAGGEGSCVVM
jgi:hypothetical protein